MEREKNAANCIFYRTVRLKTCETDSI